MGGKERAREEEAVEEEYRHPFIDELEKRAFILRSYQKARAERNASAQVEQQEDQEEPQQP